MADAIEQLVERLISSGVASQDTIVGCSEDEVAKLRADHGVQRLPEQYEQFLRVMGRGAGRLLRGTDFFYPHIFDLDESGRGLLEENDALHLLAEGSIVVGMHQGAELYWLEPSGVLNWYQEDDQEVHRSWPSLLEFLTAQADAIARRG